MRIASGCKIITSGHIHIRLLMSNRLAVLGMYVLYAVPILFPSACREAFES
jgi:hypothetical protein